MHQKETNRKEVVTKSRRMALKVDVEGEVETRKVKREV
jgi:hypothetical protein